MASRADQEVVLAALREMDPDKFEEFVADLWASKGWNTKTTPYSGDDGVDVDGERSDAGAETLAIQVKRHAPDNKVSNGVVQRLYAAANDHRDYDVVKVVTTSEFSSNAYEYAYKNDLDLIHGAELVEMIFEEGRFDLLDEYSAGGFGTGWADHYAADATEAGGGSSERRPERPKTELRGYLPHVAVLGVLVVVGMVLAVRPSTADVGALLWALGFIISPFVILADAYHLRRHNANYQPSAWWAVGAFLTMGLLAAWYAGRRALRTDLRAAIG